jgi:hypothetical protein
LSIDKSRLIAEGGSNGILLRIQDITMSIDYLDNQKNNTNQQEMPLITKLKNDDETFPTHQLDFGIYAIECRIDSAYNQATPIMAVRLSNLALRINDLWTPSHEFHSMMDINTFNNNTASIAETAAKAKFNRDALLEVYVTWDQFHLMITKSTTPDLLILYYKLIDYFEKQFTESKDYIKEWELDIFYEMRVKQQFIEKAKNEQMIKNFQVNGGSIQLKGNNFTLITFHGNNFKANRWAVFSLNEPSLEFATQTHFHGQNEQTIQQNLGFYLGRNKLQKDMASIYCVYRDTTATLTRFQTINEWFDYAHSSIDAAGLREFPIFLIDELHSAPQLRNINNLKNKKIYEQTKYEEIFHLPSLQVLCDTKQDNDNVSFAFNSDFNGYILLTIRTEMFSFLHELIKSYIIEKDIIEDKEEIIPQPKPDTRTYDCKIWQLEPTLKLVAKYGSVGAPPGVDELLKYLGLTHAKTTIPKWIQRGLLDNLNDAIYQLSKVYTKILSEQNLSKIRTSAD